jgi:hypothetical protein
MKFLQAMQIHATFQYLECTHEFITINTKLNNDGYNKIEYIQLSDNVFTLTYLNRINEPKTLKYIAFDQKSLSIVKEDIKVIVYDFDGRILSGKLIKKLTHRGLEFGIKVNHKNEYFNPMCFEIYHPELKRIIANKLQETNWKQQFKF